MVKLKLRSSTERYPGVQAVEGRHRLQAPLARGRGRGRGVAERRGAAGVGEDRGRPVAQGFAAGVGVEDAGEEGEGMVVEGQTHPGTPYNAGPPRCGITIGKP